jgi:hypothetical protein
MARLSSVGVSVLFVCVFLPVYGLQTAYYWLRGHDLRRGQ